MAHPNEGGENLDLRVTIARDHNGLYVYSLLDDEQIQVDIRGLRVENVQVEPDRSIVARSIGTRAGILYVESDSSPEPNWTERTICLGSFISRFGDLGPNNPRIARGFIACNQGVAVDLSGQHFVFPPPTYLAEYESLYLEGEPIF